jgi:hypothetical protein
MLLKEDPESLAAFSLLQWDRLGWQIPDVVVSLPKAESFAKLFASWSELFYADALQHAGEEWLLDRSILEEDSTILLISLENSYEELAEVIEAMMEAFPKKIFVLSLIPLRDST